MSHYSLAFNPIELNRWASSTAKKLKARYRNDPDYYPAFVYRGMSGAVTATALMLALQRGMMLPHSMFYVRKKAEVNDSHGAKVEHSIIGDVGGKASQIIFIDDFIDSGKTLVECIRALGELGYLSEDWTDESIFITLTGSSDKWIGSEFMTNAWIIGKIERYLVDLVEEFSSSKKEVDNVD